MARFVCQDCGYRFESEKDAEKCPYCNKDKVEQEQTAGELLNQA